jgi:hypothetical protein
VTCSRWTAPNLEIVEEHTTRLLLQDAGKIISGTSLTIEDAGNICMGYAVIASVNDTDIMLAIGQNILELKRAVLSGIRLHRRCTVESTE